MMMMIINTETDTHKHTVVLLRQKVDDDAVRTTHDMTEEVT